MECEISCPCKVATWSSDGVIQEIKGANEIILIKHIQKVLGRKADGGGCNAIDQLQPNSAG